MKINEKYPLFIKDVYLYDLEACHYNILKSFGIYVDGKDDKLKRNIEIGKLQKTNSELTNIMRKMVYSKINSFIKVNNLEDKIILRQYDGFLTDCKVDTYKQSNDLIIPIRKKYNYFISSVDRKKYMGISADDVIVKGIRYRYGGLNSIYHKFKDLNFVNKKALFRRMSNIKKEVVYSKDISMFNNGGSFHLIKYGEIKLTDEIFIKHLDVSDIDKIKYFNHYFRPFMETIYLYNM